MNTVLSRAFVSTILLLSLVVGLVLLISEHRISFFDNRITNAVQSLESPSLTVIMKDFTTIGSGIYVTVITVIILIALFLNGYRREMIFFVGVIVGSSVLNLLLKLIFHRARPDIHRIIQAAGFSFPSGHSMGAFTLYSLTMYFLWKRARQGWLRIIIILIGVSMILMIGLSRIYLGVHYPSDVIGGYLISATWLALSIGWYEHFLEERWQSKKFRDRQLQLGNGLYRRRNVT